MTHQTNAGRRMKHRCIVLTPVRGLCEVYCAGSAIQELQSHRFAKPGGICIRKTAKERRRVKCKPLQTPLQLAISTHPFDNAAHSSRNASNVTTTLKT